MTGCINFNTFQMGKLVHPAGNKAGAFVIQGTHNTTI